MNRHHRLFTTIAREYLGIETLETRNVDSLDFHDVSVMNVRTALQAAYDAGAKVPTPHDTDLPTRFDAYEVHGVVELTDAAGRCFCEQSPDDEAQFWSLYGHIPGQGLECIGDFKTRQLAEEVYARITGASYDR